VRKLSYNINTYVYKHQGTHLNILLHFFLFFTFITVIPTYIYNYKILRFHSTIKIP